MGVTYINKQLVDVLKQNGAKEIEIKIGDEFDPRFMEAVETDQTETKSNKVKKIINKGYNLNGQLVRPAKVEVG